MEQDKVRIRLCHLRDYSVRSVGATVLGDDDFNVFGEGLERRFNFKDALLNL